MAAVGGAGGARAFASPSTKTVLKTEGAVDKRVVHSYLVEEAISFFEHINFYLSKDAFLSENKYLPIADQDGLWPAISDGILLSKLINLAAPETIDERALNYPAPGKKLNQWETKENQNVVINSAKSIGVQVVNIHAADLIRAAEDHKEHLVLAIIWQVVKIQVMRAVSLREVPQLVVLLNEGEDLAALMKLPPEEVLVRWINHHLKNAGSARVVKNLHSDLKDSEVYDTVLKAIAPKDAKLESAMAKEDLGERAAVVISNARALEVPTFLGPADIASGNRHLNLAFVAQIFNAHHGLEVKKEELAKVEAAFDAAGLGDDKEDDAREERVFRMWMNSLNLESVPKINNLFDDLTDSRALIETMEKVYPGTLLLPTERINHEKLNRFKKVENGNIAVAAAKRIGLSVPGTSGPDLTDGNKKLMLGLVWQVMRLQVVSVLKDLGGGSAPKDADIVAWANGKVASSGKGASITGFKDDALTSGIFLLDLLGAIEPRAINPALVTPGATDDERAQNCKYVLSIARKLGAQVFITWEDIRDVKPKMVMTLVASIMGVANKMDKERAAEAAAAAAAGGK